MQPAMVAVWKVAETREAKREPVGAVIADMLKERDAGRRALPTSGKKQSKAATPSTPPKIAKVIGKVGKQAGAKSSYSVERSRCNVQARTGLKGPNQTKSFRFGPGKTYPNEQVATDAARRWCSESRVGA